MLGGQAAYEAQLAKTLRACTRDDDPLSALFVACRAVAYELSTKNRVLFRKVLNAAVKNSD